MKTGDILICKRSADEKYFKDIKNDYTYKNISYREWSYPEKGKEFEIVAIEQPMFKGQKLIFLKDVLRHFNTLEYESNTYNLWDWFYTDRELRKLKLEKIKDNG